METEEVIKLVDNIYKNILEKFNPGARQLISAGKAYLKALHGAAAASRIFNEALSKIASNAQQGGTTDIGSALMNIVGVYKEIQDQHMNILKAFYVDLLVPLETNLEKDTKVVQFEQKKFLQQHKIRADSYTKAAATMKKQRKKKNNSQNADKEIKTIQALDEEKNKLNAFCEQSLKNAMTQERRRYGFVLERQCSLAKHWMAYHIAGKNCIAAQIENWEEVSSSREFLPPNMENMFARQIIDTFNDDDSDRGSIISALRKTRSIDASCLDMRSIADVAASASNMPRAKSEYNLTSNSTLEPPKCDKRTISRGLYAYLSSGENQLSFLEGDRIALVGDRAKGWQFGENLRTQMFGWFPIAYTELEHEDNHSNWGNANQRNGHQHQHLPIIEQTPDSSLESTIIEDDIPLAKGGNHYQDDSSPTRMFGDTIMYRQSKQFRRVSGGGQPKPGPPPTLPAPVPTPVVPSSYPKGQIIQSHSFSSAGEPPGAEKKKTVSATTNYTKQSSSSSKPKARSGVTSTSLHSSNDSGFANDPPPQPDVDYSDEDAVIRVPIRSHHIDKPSQSNKKSRIPRRSHDLDSSTMESTKKARSMTSHRSQQQQQQQQLNIRQSSSFGNLADESDIDYFYRTVERKNGNLIKRTKSFWKFGKSDDILEGMSLWKHRDLVLTESERDEENNRVSTLKRQKNTEVHSISTNSSETLKNSPIIHNISSSVQEKVGPPQAKPREISQVAPIDETKYHFTKSEIDQRISLQKDENLYTIQKTRTQSNQSANRNKVTRNNYADTENESDGRRQPRQEKHRSNRSESKIPHSSNNNKNGHSKSKSNNANSNVNHSSSSGNAIASSNMKSMKYYENRDNDDSLNDGFEDSSLLMNSNSIRVRDTDFYDDESVDDLMLKTVKRQEILKQYYSSGTDTERNSSSSDPYDCIVVDDHLVRKENEKFKNSKMDFKTFRSDDKDSGMESSSRTATLLPRTKLSKSSGATSNSYGVAKHSEKQPQQQQQQLQQRRMIDHERDRDRDKRSSGQSETVASKSYGPWYDLWGTNGSAQQ